MTKLYVLILFLTALLIYSLKALRLYFLISGEGVSFFKFGAAFSVTTILNIIVPFKIGEIFRFFCFGHLTKNYLKGFSIVLLDRFADILSLLFIFFVMKFLKKAEFSWIFFFLLSVCVFLILFYLALKNLLSYWNEYFVKSSPSKRHLNALLFLGKISVMYGEIKTLISGRFFVIFTLSVFSWGIEIMSLVLCKKFFSTDSKNLISNYLSAALTGISFEPLDNFIQMSVAFLGMVFAILIFMTILKDGFGRLNQRQFWQYDKIRGRTVDEK